MAKQFRLIQETISGDIPFLELTPSESAEPPVLLLLHGLLSRKDDQLNRMYAFASQGYRVIALDARLHGERDGADERDLRLQSDYHSTMYGIITGTVADISTLLDALQISRAAILGISLGAIIAFDALIAETRLRAAVTAMGSPDWVELARQFGMPDNHPMLTVLAGQSPLNRAARSYPPRPLLMLHGEMDARIPVNGVRALYERLLPEYHETADRLKLVIYDDLDHVYTDEMLRESIDWMQRHFPAGL